jgi:rare lipoprotein A
MDKTTRRKTYNSNLKSRLWISLAIGATAFTLVAIIGMISTTTVHADTQQPKPTLVGPPAISPTPEPLARRRGLSEMYALRGEASWYGGDFNGRRTADGEVYNMFGMTACHPTLPFGSVVRVVNLENNRSVVVRITDRGNLLHKRILDLSYGAAEKLAMVHSGVAPVKLEVLALGDGRYKKSGRQAEESGS